MSETKTPPATQGGDPAMGMALLVLSAVAAPPGFAWLLYAKGTPAEKVLLEAEGAAHIGAFVASAVGCVMLAAVFAVFATRPVHYHTPEFLDWAEGQKSRGKALPTSVTRKLYGPPVLVWAAVVIPYLIAFAIGLVRYRFPEVPLEMEKIGKVFLMMNKFGNWLNGGGVPLGWAGTVFAFWSVSSTGYQRRLLEQLEAEITELPDPGDYQKKVVAEGESRSWKPSTWRQATERQVWRKYPRYLLGYRESRESLEFEPDAEVPSPVFLEGATVFGGLAVFGEKGSGKSELLKSLLNQTLHFRCEEAERRPSVSVFEVKGDLLRVVDDIAGKVGRSADLQVVGVGEGFLGWNPFCNLTPLVTAQEVKEMGFLVSACTPRSGGDAAFFEASGDTLTANCLALLTLAGESITFIRLLELIRRTSNEKPDVEFREKLYTRAESWVERLPERRRKTRLNEIATLKDYFEVGFGQMNDKTRTSIVANAVLFPQMFEGDVYQRAFCQELGAPNQFKGFEQVIDDGRVFVLNMRKIDHGDVATSICMLAKLMYHRAIMRRNLRNSKRDGSRETYDRVAFALYDEYQAFATDTPKASDSEYFELARSFEAIDVIATQGVASLRNAVGRDAADRILLNMNSSVTFRNNDEQTVQRGQALVGEKVVERQSTSVSEASNRTTRNVVLPGRFGESEHSVTRSISTSLDRKSPVTGELVAGLSTFEAIGIFSTTYGRQLSRFAVKPYWLLAAYPETGMRTPHSEVLDATHRYMLEAV